MKNRKQIKLEVQTSIAIALGTALLLTACTYPSQQVSPSIKIDGSSTVYPITQKAVAEFKASHDKPVEITVDISGTGGGFRKFCQGQTDISSASRPIQEKEMTMCNRYGVSYIELPIAFDALTCDHSRTAKKASSVAH